MLTVESGEKGFEAVRRDEFDLVITDMQMPGMDGVETTEQIRSFRPDQDVMVVTGHKDVEKAVAAMKSGVSEYLLKPINPDEFLHVVSQILFRQSLSREHSRLISENVEFNAILAANRRCLPFFKVYDLDRLCDLILDTLMDLLRAEGAAIRFDDEPADLPRQCQRGLVQVDADTAVGQSSPAAGAALFDEGRSIHLPVEGEGTEEGPLAVISVESPLGRESFGREDLNIATAVVEFAANALHAALRYRRVEDTSLKASRRQAYNMAFFRDNLDREMQKTRRFDRPLSLLRLRVANDADLRMAFREHHVEQMMETLLERVRSVLREADILAMASPCDYYVLLPETDHWGALMTQKRLRKAIEGIGVAESKKSLPAEVQLRGASMPADGSDFETLSRVLLDRLEALPHSLVERRALQPLTFWKGVEKLVGQPGDYRLTDGGFEVAERLQKNEDDLRSCYFRMPLHRLDDITRVFCREVVDSHRGRGVIYRSCADFDQARRQLPLAGAQEKSSTTLYLLGGDRRVDWDYRRTVPVYIDDERFRKLFLLLYLTEDQAYGIFAWRKGAEIVGFHTADFYCVETMIAKLQEQYRLQDPA